MFGLNFEAPHVCKYFPKLAQWINISTRRIQATTAAMLTIEGVLYDRYGKHVSNTHIIPKPCISKLDCI